MLNIRPVSDLRNRFSEVEEDVLSKGEPVFLTKNGYGSMVLLSLEQYEELTNDVELALDEATVPLTFLIHAILPTRFLVG